MRRAASSSLADRQALQQADPLGQRGGEVDLAVHGARRDAGDLVAQAEEVGQLVQHLVLDHGRFHVGHEQPLAPAGGRHDDRVDGGHGDGLSALPVERDVAGDAGRQPVGRADRGALRRSSSTARRIAPSFERRTGAALGDQDEDVFHAPALAAEIGGFANNAARHGQAATVIVVTGPTASGKSALALALAEARGGTVINADAMQTYDAFPILTAQPTAEERAARAASRSTACCR